MSAPSEEKAGAVARLAVRCGAELAGQRLDRALAALLPGMGLRGRRRRVEGGAVLVNGRPGRAAQRLRAGDWLELLPAGGMAASGGPACSPGGVGADDVARLLERQGRYCFFYKPAGLHSAALAGGGGPSLEALLPRLLGRAADGEQPAALPVLLQRLDYGTSGLICAACDAAAAAAFRAAEAAGECEKRYLAVLEGRLAAPVTVRNALDTARRARSLVLPDTAEAVRWTEFLPLHFWDAAALPKALSGLASHGGATLAACRIRRGARHQIRAHAARMGHPLAGDSLYGASGALSGRAGFCLHHGGLRVPGAQCAVPPPWTFLSAADTALSAAWLADARG